MQVSELNVNPSHANKPIKKRLSRRFFIFRSHHLRLVVSGYVVDFTSPADQPLRMAPSRVAG